MQDTFNAAKIKSGPWVRHSCSKVLWN